LNCQDDIFAKSPRDAQRRLGTKRNAAHLKQIHKITVALYSYLWKLATDWQLTGNVKQFATGVNDKIGFACICLICLHFFEVFMEFAATTDIRDMMDIVGEVSSNKLQKKFM
jgi:hypothetical protein